MNSDLFSLIHSLTKGERRYFRMYARRFTEGGESAYEQLFRLICEATPEEEDLLKEKALSFIPAGQYNYTRHYLKELILRMLREFHYQESLEMELRSKLDQLELLFARRLYAGAVKTLRQIEKTARYYGFLTIYPHITAWKRKLRRRAELNLNEDWEYEAEQLKNLELLSVDTEITQLYDRVFALLQKDRRLELVGSQKELQTLKTLNEQLDFSDPLPFPTQSTLLVMRANLTHLAGDFQATCACYSELVKLWEAHPHQIKVDTERFSQVISAWLNSLFLARKAEEMLEEVTRIRGLTGLQKPIKRKIRYQTYNMELLVYMNKPALQKALALIPEIQAFLSKQEKVIPAVDLCPLWFNLAGVFFMAGRWKRVSEYTGKILALPREAVQKGAYRATRLFQLIVAYELGDIDRLDSHIRSMDYLLKQQKLDWEEGKLFRDSFSKLVKTPGERDRQDLLAVLLKDLETLEKPGQGSQGIFFYRNWLQKSTSPPDRKRGNLT